MPNQSTKGVMPSPRFYKIFGYTLILFLFGGLGSWAAIAKIDSAVVANGVVAVESNRKNVQHLEGGIVEKIYVKDGDFVKAGQPLVKLKNVQAKANFEIYSDRIHIAQAVEARLLAQRELSKTITFPQALLDSKDKDVKAAVADQRKAFDDQMGVLNSQVDILNSRIVQFKREITGLKDQKKAYQDRLTFLNDKLERLRKGASDGVVSSNLVASREEEFIEVKANVGRLDTELAKVENSINEIKLQIIQVNQQFKEKASTEYKEVKGQIQENLQHLDIAKDTLARLLVDAPVDGTIQNLQVHTTDGIVRPGEVMMEIVPENDQLVINVQVSPVDGDNVQEGLKTEIRFVSFQGRFTPVLFGVIKNISRDVITPSDGRSPPYFLAKVDVVKDNVPKEIKERLSAGMPADVVIKTGEDTVANYLISPLKDAITRSMTEE